MFCTECGKPVPAGGAFCPACGTPSPKPPVDAPSHDDSAAGIANTEPPHDSSGPVADGDLTVVRPRIPVTNSDSKTLRADPPTSFANCQDCGILLSPTETAAGTCSSCGGTIVAASPPIVDPTIDQSDSQPARTWHTPEAAASSATTCLQCGTTIDSGAAACPACGTSTTPDPDPIPPAESPTEPRDYKAVLVAGIVAVVVALAVAFGWFIWQQLSGDEAPESAAPATTATSPRDSSTTTTSPTTTTPDATVLPSGLVTELEATGVFVEPDSTADRASLQASVLNARRHEWGLSVAALATKPDDDGSAIVNSIAAAVDSGTIVFVAPNALGWASEDALYDTDEMERARALIPSGSSEDEAFEFFVKSVLGGPDTVGVVGARPAMWDVLRADGTRTEFSFGSSTDTPIAGDWNCDGIATPGVWRASTTEALLRNVSSAGAAKISPTYGIRDAIPLAGDFNGDGCDTVSFYIPATGQVRIFNTATEVVAASVASIPSDIEYKFGDDRFLPFVGDFDGDGIDTIGLFRSSTAVVYLKNTHTAGPADVKFSFGESGDLPLAGDWGPEDGIDSIAVYRPTSGSFLFRYTNSDGAPDETMEFGDPGGAPITGPFGLERSE